MIALRGVVKHFSDGDETLTVLDGVDLSVERGELVAIVGVSGSGKSTLLYLTGGLDADFQGEVTVAGHSLHSLSSNARARFRNESVGFVFQSFNLIRSMSALDNVCLPAFFRTGLGLAPGGVREAGLTALERVGLGQKAHKRPAQLSGGERQRVAIARAIFAKPRVLLADEPTGNLDGKTAAGIVELFQELAANGITVVIATHEERVSRIAGRILRLEDGRLT